MGIRERVRHGYIEPRTIDKIILQNREEFAAVPLDGQTFDEWRSNMRGMISENSSVYRSDEEISRYSYTGAKLASIGLIIPASALCFVSGVQANQFLYICSAAVIGLGEIGYFAACRHSLRLPNRHYRRIRYARS